MGMAKGIEIRKLMAIETLVCSILFKFSYSVKYAHYLSSTGSHRLLIFKFRRADQLSNVKLGFRIVIESSGFKSLLIRC